MNELDEQEQAIVRALVRNPRTSDNRISQSIGVPVRTVSRKRARLEEAGVLKYYTAVELQSGGTGRFNTQHMIIIKFRLGITSGQIHEEIRCEPNVANVFAELIRDSYLAEVDGHASVVMVLEGESDSDIVDSLQGEIVPSLQSNHGEDCIDEIRTIRVLGIIRREHNYLPMVNMTGALLSENWADEAIFVG